MGDLTLLGESPFDAIRRTREDGSEYWSARDLMLLMGYARWESFLVPIERAMRTAKNTNVDVASNFRESPKISATRPGLDYELSRFAAYLVAMNGDPNKPEVAEAQAYFAIKTNEAETALQLPDISTPAGVLVMAEQFAATARHLVAAEQRLAEQAPLVAQAKAHRAGKRDITRQDFAREVVKWAHQEHDLRIKHDDVFAFLAHLKLFIKPGRSDTGQATTNAILRGLADNDKGTTPGGFNFSTGKLTPQGQGYAWDRIERFVEANGTLELPRQIGEAS